MINVANWGEIKQRYEDYWNFRNKRPVVYLSAPKDGGRYNFEEVSPETRWFDPKWNVKSNRNSYENTFYALEGYPYVSPSLGPDLISAILGYEIKYNEASSWVTHKDCPLSDLTDFQYDEQNFFLKKMDEFLNAYSEDAKNGDYIVGMVDLNTLLDGVSSFVGAQNLCFEIMDNPEDVHRAQNGHVELFKKIYNRYNSIITKYQKGSTNWLGIYGEPDWYYISNDFIVMLSSGHFDEFVESALRNVASFLGRNLFHLDGEHMLLHLESLLKIKELTGIQVQATPAMQSAKFWVPHLKKIQASGKCTWIEAKNQEEVRELIENLDPEGLFIKTWAFSEAEARETQKMVLDYYG